MTVHEHSLLDDPTKEENITPPSIEVASSNGTHPPPPDPVQQLYDEYGGQLDAEHNATMHIAPIDIHQHVAPEHQPLVHEAGQGGAVVGMLVGGPIGCALVGFGAAYAVRKDNALGRAARTLGQYTRHAKQKISHERHVRHVYEQSVKTVNKLCEDTNTTEEQQYAAVAGTEPRAGHQQPRTDNNTDPKNKNIAFRTRAFFRTGWTTTTQFTKDHQLVEKGVEGTGKGIEFVGDTFNTLKDKCGTLVLLPTRRTPMTTTTTNTDTPTTQNTSTRTSTSSTLFNAHDDATKHEFDSTSTVTASHDSTNLLLPESR